MASRKKKISKVLNETIDLLRENFGNRIAFIDWYYVPNQWISPHAEAVVLVQVKRGNRDLYTMIYDIVYKKMYSRNFDHLIALNIFEKKEEKNESNSEDVGVLLWKVG
jgi:hypothetical protein